MEEWLQFPTTIADTNKNHSHISEYRINSVLNMTGKLTEKIVASRLAWDLKQLHVSIYTGKLQTQ